MNTRPPAVSVVLPTFNRADVLMRAVDSVVGQTFEDWELLIVDDGSTDSTPRLDFGFDRRIRVIRQSNAGVSAARNTGIAEGRGRFVAFLDSDDQWLPHFLELCVGFLTASPQDHYVTTEFYSGTRDVRRMRHAIADTYAHAARMIGSRALDLPEGESDDYLRIWPSRQPIGPWGAKFLTGEVPCRDYLYQGDVFEHTRWGYLAWLPATVLTQHALQVVGGFDEQARTAEDYPFQATLARHFRSSFISIPSARKFERGVGAAPLAEDHLATGRSAYRFRVNRLRYFDELHWKRRMDDPELAAIHRQYAFGTGALAMRHGMRREAVEHFREASRPDGRLGRAYLLLALALVLPGRLAAATHRYWDWLA